MRWASRGRNCEVPPTPWTRTEKKSAAPNATSRPASARGIWP
jgi:hypothetical protein